MLCSVKIHYYNNLEKHTFVCGGRGLPHDVTRRTGAAQSVVCC